MVVFIVSPEVGCRLLSSSSLHWKASDKHSMSWIERAPTLVMQVLTRLFLDMYKRTCESSKIGLKSYPIVELQLV